MNSKGSVHALLNKDHRDHHIEELISALREAGSLSGEALADASAAHPGLPVLQAALQGAVTLEFATLPPYLTAIWSLKDELHPVAKSLREVLQEEMLHMALACNLLASVGGTPAISHAVPVYPGKLPLGVHPELIVPLRGLSPDSLKVFLEIERPGHPGHFQSLQALKDEDEFSQETHAQEDGDFTIGDMYDQILAAFQLIKPDLCTRHQITGPLAWFVVSSQDDVVRAVRTIQTQGEGSSSGPDSTAGNHAHYYRFAEMLEQKKLMYNSEANEWEFSEPFPLNYEKDVWPVGEVPDGGFNRTQIKDPGVNKLLDGFNLAYSQLLDLLDSVWKPDGGQAAFWKAVGTMFSLEEFAKPLMALSRPDGMHYCPEWKYIPEKERK